MGSARVELEFAHGADINEILIRVNNALSRVSNYPENVGGTESQRHVLFQCEFYVFSHHAAGRQS